MVGINVVTLNIWYEYMLCSFTSFNVLIQVLLHSCFLYYHLVQYKVVTIFACQYS